MVINFSMDFLSLYVTAKILHIKAVPKRLTLGALLGALYSLLALNSLPSGAVGFIITIAVSFLLTLTAFGRQSARALLHSTSVFCLTGFALGGGITAVCNMLNIWQNKKELVINGTHGVVYGDIPFGLLIILALVCGLFSLISGRIAKRKSAIRAAEIKITVFGSTSSVTGLIDSGNLLKEPISGKPVIITTYEAARKLLPISMIPVFRDSPPLSSDSPELSRLRIIPSSTVGGKSLLYAFLPDRVEVDGKPADVYIAISRDTADFGGYPALIPSEII